MATLIEEDEIPTPEAIPQGFYASEPALPAGAMNAQALPQVYGTASDNAYLSEQRALAGLDPRYRRQEALMKAEIEEQAMRTAGQLEYQQLVQGGALPEEAYRRVAGKLNWNHPDKLALALDRLAAPGVIPGSVNSVPILGDQGARIGDAVYGSKGELHATRFSDPNRLTPEQKMATKFTDRDLNDQRRKIDQLYRTQQSAGRLADPNNPEIKAAEAAYETLKQQARSGGKAVEAPKSSNTVIKYDKSGKAWRVDPETKKVLGPAN